MNKYSIQKAKEKRERRFQEKSTVVKYKKECYFISVKFVLKSILIMLNSLSLFKNKKYYWK